MDRVVSADWLAARLDDDRIRVVDIRDEWEYAEIGHVPGAVNVPFDRIRSEDGDTGLLPGADAWRAIMEAAGIEPSDRLVAYDDGHGVFAARFLVTAELYGHGERALLDGDYSAWARTHPTTTEQTTVEQSVYAVEPPTETALVDYEAVRRIVDGAGTEAVGTAMENVTILDTRERWEYDEGHLPGAVHLDWRELVSDETRGLRPRDELERVLTDHDISREFPVLLYCNTARRISHTYLVLRHLGYEDVLFYEGSLDEWRARGGELVTESETRTGGQ